MAQAVLGVMRQGLGAVVLALTNAALKIHEKRFYALKYTADEMLSNIIIGTLQNNMQKVLYIKMSILNNSIFS